jgi:tungstate transport system substrate-binding protein
MRDGFLIFLIKLTEVCNMRRCAVLAVLLSLGLFLFSAAALAEAPACTETYGNGSITVRLATGSPGELGLVKALAEEFCKTHDAKICWIQADSGAALQMLKDKAVDMCMSHSPALEKKAVEEGWAANRTLIGSNEFYIVGPEDDPAGIREAKTAVEAFTKIANSKATFLSRGDNSGTHVKEMSIWKKAGITPSGDWYVVTGDFMIATLKKCDELRGYFMTDSSTWITVKKDIKNLTLLFRGDPEIVNIYHALTLPDDSDSTRMAVELVKFMASEEGQEIFRTFGVAEYGEPLYNDAEYAKQFEK